MSPVIGAAPSVVRAQYDTATVVLPAGDPHAVTVANGAVRDADSIIELGFPVFCRGLCIKGTNKNQPGRVNVPVMIGGVDIHPGDIVVGDRDGLVVVARNEVAEVIRASEERERKEATMRERLKQGATMVELLGLQDTLNRYGLV